MEYSVNAQSIKAAQQSREPANTAADIDGASRDNFLRNMPGSLATTIIPFSLLAVCCLQLDTSKNPVILS